MTFWLLTFASASLASAEGLIESPESGWPQWRGRCRDGISKETGLLESWDQDGPRLLWKVGGLGTGWSAPIISDQRIYITGDIDTDLYIFAFDIQGRLLWKTKNGASWQGSYPGARASCCYSERHVYHLNAHGRLVCLDAVSGRELWAVDIFDRFEAKNITWALSECLLVDGSKVIVTPGGEQALMAALDKRNGVTVWVTPNSLSDATSYCSPILFQFDDRRLIANCSSAHGFGVDAENGKLLWTVPLKNIHQVNTATPIYGQKCIFFVTPYAEEGRLYQLTPGSVRWSVEQRWQSPLDTVTGSGVLINKTLYAAGYRKNKWWLGIDWETGETRCQQKEFTTGAAIYADGRLYCFDDRGAVGLLNPTGDRLDVAGKFQLVTERVRDAWAHPVLLDGRLYLRYHDTLYCYDVRKPTQTDDIRRRGATQQ